MTAVMLRRPATAPAPDSRPPRRPATGTDLYTWVLSVNDWRLHTLAEPAALPMIDPQLTRCRRWHLIACPVDVVRRDELCTRCMAGGVQGLEMLPARTAAEQARSW